MRRAIAWAAVAAAACALAACKPIATGEADPILAKRYKITEVAVFPPEESHRVQLQTMSAMEDEKVGISILEGDQQFLGELLIETVENSLKIDSSRETGTRFHRFIMPNGDVRVKAAFTWKASDNAKLQALNPSTGTLVPAFSPDITSYTLEFHTPQAVSLAFNPIPEHPGASYAAAVVGGKPLAPLVPGLTTYTVVVTPQDTEAPLVTYTVAIKKYPDASLSRLEVASPAETSESALWTTGLYAPAGPYLAKLPWVNSAPGAAVLTVETVNATTAITATGAVTDLSSKTATIALPYEAEKRVVIDTSCTVDGLTETNRYEVVLSRYDGQIPVLKASGGEIIRVLWNAAAQRWEEAHVFHTSGTLAFTQTPNVSGQIFVVGGGGCGGSNTHSGPGANCNASGGSSGVVKNQAFLFNDASYAVVVGAGGGPTAYWSSGSPGGAASSFDTILANGGGGRGLSSGTGGTNGGGTSTASSITGFAEIYAKPGLAGAGVEGRPHTGDGGGGAYGAGSRPREGWAGGSGIAAARFPL